MYSWSPVGVAIRRESRYILGSFVSSRAVSSNIYEGAVSSSSTLFGGFARKR